MPPIASQRFSFSKGRDSFSTDGRKTVYEEIAPSLKLQTDKDVYRAGNQIIATIEIGIPDSRNRSIESEHVIADGSSFLVESVTFELKGIEKLDSQWFATRKPLSGSNQRRGENVFLDCTTSTIVSKVMVSSRCTKTYLVRAELPKLIPPSYRGTSVRYIYYIRSTLCGHWMVQENGHCNSKSKGDLMQLEARAPLNIWVTQKTSGLLNDEGNVPETAIQSDIYWKEKDGDSEWTRASGITDGLEEGYESSRDEVSSICSYNPARGNMELAFQSSLSFHSPVRSSSQEFSNVQGENSGSTSYTTPPRLSVSEALHDPRKDATSPGIPFYSSNFLSSSYQTRSRDSGFPIDEIGVPSTPRTIADAAASEGFIRGRSYNIRMDGQVLLRFSPKNSDSNYYFSDMIGGTLTFFHGGARRCLEVLITLETSESISQCYLHPSRRNSSTITKAQSEHHEVVSDLVQTSFLFSIPADGPMSFSTPHVSVSWALRFEFFTTPKNLDWKRYEHPLLVEERDKCEWVLPITVHAPPSRAHGSDARNDKPLSFSNIWNHA